MSALPSLADLFSLAGRTALVTGGGSGIGRGIARALAGAGAEVVIVARRPDVLEAAMAEIIAGGGRGRTITGDVSTRDGVRAVIASASDEIDIVVSSAGINLRPPMAEITDDVWDATMAVNLDAPFLLGRHYGPRMAARGYGRLIHLSSQQAQRPFADSGAYGVSKAAVEGLARVQSEAWAAAGVTANALVPGFVPTPLNEKLWSRPGVSDALAARTHVGRNGTPEDFGAAAVFLAGPGSSYVTGQTIAVDGGFSVH
ncbi:SDR family NAD(P)-dependent oxidoreductase [Microbacterium gorillae]|uniref:SDR family NAD(P)-dependent oxidoreductase n=1 Tax=Microbacterium gorillae TaxID=1231063 RepID=UPI00059175C6|nr:SDR family oxidoreductase [Microbacterium gorillae]